MYYDIEVTTLPIKIKKCHISVSSDKREFITIKRVSKDGEHIKIHCVAIIK